MYEATKKVAVLELRRLLVELKEHRPDICIRYRLIGQMWAQSFHQVVHVTEENVILNDESSNKLVTVRDLSHIIQFELDKPFQLYQPYYHYDVSSTTEW
jgi:hypothetical protein